MPVGCLPKKMRFCMRNHLLAALAVAVPSFAIPLVNQLGFTPESEKIVVIPGNDANTLEVRDMAGKVVLSLEAPMVYDWEYSGEEVQTYDISAIKKPGTYRLFRDGYIGNPVVVGEDVYVDVTKAALKWFYFQRAGMALETRYAGKWARAMGHVDDSVIVYGTDLPTAKTVAKANGKPEPKKADAKIIRSQRGWYDAGDYGKYIVNSGITVFTLLEMYEHFPAFVDTLHWNIPREFPKMPELLEEIRWNLDWMLSMQDKDGGVYHKLTSLKFGSSTMPELDGALRYAIEKSLTATLDFAAVMAQARMLKASEVAYYWAKRHPKALYKQPSDVQTGDYTHGGEDGKDEFAFAATELYRATKKAEYLKDLKPYKFRADGPWWGDVNMLAIYHAALDSADFGAKVGGEARKTLLHVAKELRNVGDTSAYRLPAFPSSWNWGSNSAMANNGIVLLHAYYVTGDKSFLDGAQQCLDYLLGKNPMEISYVTGFGFRSPRFPHHRVSESDFVDDPVPGMLVGGPHLGKQDINLDGTELWKCPNYATADKPALAYIDNRCSYATNEVAINWNAPLAYLAGALQAIYSGHANAVVK